MLTSRRMCYRDRRLILAVHRIDDSPVPLFGRVAGCTYESDALYRVVVELLPIPAEPWVTEWALGRRRP